MSSFLHGPSSSKPSPPSRSPRNCSKPRKSNKARRRATFRIAGANHVSIKGKRETEPTALEPKKLVEACLRQPGHESDSIGDTFHDAQGLGLRGKFGSGDG